MIRVSFCQDYEEMGEWAPSRMAPLPTSTGMSSTTRRFHFSYQFAFERDYDDSTVVYRSYFWNTHYSHADLIIHLVGSCGANQVGLRRAVLKAVAMISLSLDSDSSDRCIDY